MTVTMAKMRIVTGIGSRETPPDICAEMTKIGEYIRERDWWCRSGHAAGADYAFELGARDQCILYLPWTNFRFKEAMPLGPFYILPDPIPQWCINCLSDIGVSLPARSGVAKLFARNTMQLLGKYGDRPSDAVIVWTKNGTATGGSGIAMKLAYKLGIPVYNMYHQKSAEKAIEFLEGLKG